MSPMNWTWSVNRYSFLVMTMVNPVLYFSCSWPLLHSLMNHALRSMAEQPPMNRYRWNSLAPQWQQNASERRLIAVSARSSKSVSVRRLKSAAEELTAWTMDRNAPESNHESLNCRMNHLWTVDNRNPMGSISL